MHAPSVILSFIRTSLISRVYFAYSVERKLFESVWLGPQAFYQATAFNANIGAWNTASMKTMASVCALYHHIRERRVWLGLGCGTVWPACRRTRPVEVRAMHACLCASLISRDLHLHE